MKNFLKRTVVAFAIGLLAGSTFAHADTKFGRKPASIELSEARPIASREIIDSGDAVYAQTETFVVRNENIVHVNKEMTNLALQEDVDYAWLAKSSNHSVNFVCYNTECNQWARKFLRSLAKAPARPEDRDFRNAWKDPALEGRVKPQLTEEEKIKQRQQIHYKSLKQS